MATTEEAWTKAKAEYELVLSALEDGVHMAHDDCECPTTVALEHHTPLCRRLRQGLRIKPAGRERHDDATRTLTLAVLEELSGNQHDHDGWCGTFENDTDCPWYELRRSIEALS